MGVKVHIFTQNVHILFFLCRFWMEFSGNFYNSDNIYIVIVETILHSSSSIYVNIYVD